MKKIIFATLVAAFGLMTSCDNYLDINQNPNSPTENNVTSDMILPAAEMNLAAAVGNYLRIPAGYFAEHYSQTFGTSNFLDYSRFKATANSSSACYTQLATRTLNNLKNIIEKSEASGDNGTLLAATVLRAYTYQVLVDCYGEIPYSQALDISNTAPKYDDGQDIYDGILKELDDALAKAKSSDPVATSLLLPGQTADAWVKVANALKLKILMRESGVKNVDSLIAAIIEEDNLPEADVEWAGCWADEKGKGNPFYQEEFATYFGSTQTNVVLNLALLMTFSSQSDPRLETFFNPNGSGEYKGAVSGTNFSTSDNYKAAFWCRPNVKFNSPVSFISLAEINFFKAEYYAKNNKLDKANEAMKAAIEASFASADLEGADAIVAQNTLTASNYKQVIGVQKWLALSGVNNFESWCELRRLKYPAFGTTTGAQIYIEASDSYNPDRLAAGQLYAPINVNADLIGGKTIQRFPYPESSINRNSNAPAQKSVAEPVFWAK